MGGTVQTDKLRLNLDFLKSDNIGSQKMLRILFMVAFMLLCPNMPLPS